MTDPISPETLAAVEDENEPVTLEQVDRLAQGIAQGVAAGLSAKPGPAQPEPIPEPITWKGGDKVRSLEGHKLVVISQGAAGSAVHCESAEGVKPYVNTYFAAASLKKGH
jgi:hypothetical protein